MSVGKNSISRISKKDAEHGSTVEEVKVETAAVPAAPSAEKAPAKASAAGSSAHKSASRKATSPKSVKPAASKPKTPQKAEQSGIKIYQVSEELPYYLL